MVKILLDPGHGRQRRGFVNVSGWAYCSEGENNFIYARDYLKPALERAGFTVGMTKTSIGQDPPLSTRGHMGRGYDLLLSIHTNAANGKATGTEIWDSTNPKESDKKNFGILCASIAKAIGTNNRGVKYKRSKNGSNYYGILRHGYAKKNAIIEHVFHDNYTDAKKFITNMKQSAEATVSVLASIYGLSKVSVGKDLPKPVDIEQDFIELVWKNIKDTQLRILPSVTIAQAILETGWGKSELARNANNLFGIKSSNDWTGETYKKETTEENDNGEKYKVMADFRKYKTIEESVIDHDNFFVSTDWRKNNYKPVLEATDYKTQAKALQSCGYATDSSYASLLIGIIERNGLQTFDKGVNSVEQAKNIKDPSKWAEESWKWGIEKGITDGTQPRREATREEVVTMLKRAMEVKEDGKHSNPDNSGSGYRTGL